MSTSVTEDELFTDQVSRWTGAALERHPASFGALLRSLPGIDPSLVVDALARVDGTHATATTLWRAAVLLDEARTPSAPAPPSSRPVPHPLDCYWPTNPATLRSFRETLGRCVPRGGTVVYLGSPNVFAEARIQLVDRRHVLLEHDEQRAASHRDPAGASAVYAVDVLRDALPAVRGQAVIADPPWYPLELKGFLWTAAHLATPGAAVLLALPPLGTRPGVELERREVLDWAAACGLRPRRLHPGVLGYLTPPFERAALVASGVPGTPEDWRRGDLMIFEAQPAKRPPRPSVPAECWAAVTAEEVPLRMRADDPPPASPVTPVSLLRGLIDGDVLPTVSRRAAIRVHARLWTSRNRIFTSAHPALLAAVVKAVAEAKDPVRAASDQLQRPLSPVERQAVRATTTRLRDLIAVERREHGLS